MDVDARLEALQSENQRLRDEIEGLRQQLGMQWDAPPELNLTGKEGQILVRLLRGGTVTKDAFMDALYSDRIDDEPEIKIIDVFVCKMRKKLKPYGVEVQTVWGRGYQMTPATIEAFYERFPLARRWAQAA